jgi:hypothetical protein
VLFALGLTMIVLLIGLVVDGGTAFVNRRDAQNDADLAAVAGTKIVKDFYTTDSTLRSVNVYNAIDARMTANKCVVAGGTPCSWSAEFANVAKVPDSNPPTVLGAVTADGSAIPSNTNAVLVHVSRQPSTFFLGIIGKPTWQVTADATALTRKVTEVGPGTILPIGTNPPNPFVAGQSYLLTDNNPYGPGAFGWLSWTGSNATGTLSTSICTPNNPAMTFPTNVYGEPGAHNGSAVRDCLDYWILHGTPVLIPVFDTCAPCNGNNASVHVTGLASFVLTSYDGSGPAINNITGRYLGTYSTSAVPAGSGTVLPTAGDAGAVLQLIR